jgi:lipoprotein-anchoring transpeptidase ErfK/SrfK
MRLKSLAVACLLCASPTGLAAQDTVSLQLPSSAPANLFSDGRSRDVLIAQVLLDRARHSPGVIDGMMGGNTARAIRAFQRASGMAVDGRVSPGLLQALVRQQSGNIVQSYTITEEDVSGPFVDVPAGFEAQAKLQHLAYETPAEKLAEKFHMSQAFLEALNPNTDFGRAGTEIIVVAAGSDRLEQKVARIEVDKGNAALRAYAEDGTLVASYPATIGSSEFPSPSGSMEVRAIAPEPKYYFSPEGRDWGPDERLTIAAGPNNPVGSTWIDLTKDGYGLHGSPDPSLIGKTSSHGCVRLTNWDAKELASAVGPGVKVEFV